MGLKAKIKIKKAKVAVIGLGYVGLPLATQIQECGFEVFGIEKKSRIKTLLPELTALKIKAFADYELLAKTDIIIITVPTPLTKNHEPDLSFVLSATKEIAKYLRKGQLVILESTTYPGTTEEELLPILSSNGFEVGKNFFLAFSPERIDPANKKHHLKNIPKIVGGVTPTCLEMTSLFYKQFIDTIIPVSTTRVAEMAKILENIFRSVNVALVNELMLLCDRMKIDIWEVVEAASTKPFGFMSFNPGPGLGGHCIPVDPFYLSWKAREYEFHSEFIELAGKVNQGMPYYVIGKLIRALNDRGKAINGSKVLILGIAYKKDISDVRESPAKRIIQLLNDRQAKIRYHDPYVSKIIIDKHVYRSIPLDKQILKEFDVTVIVANHSNIDYKLIAKESSLIVDTRNVYANIKDDNIVRI